MKNLFRTGVIALLLAEPEVRVVALMKSAERVARYQKEFAHPGLSYEVVPYGGVFRGRLNTFFEWLKFALLRTETTDLHRLTTMRQTGNVVSYWVGKMVNRLIARPSVVRLARALDLLLVRDSAYRPYFDKHAPDLVFLAHLFEEPETHILREAKRRGIKTVALVNSWDKVTTRCVMRLLPEKVIVFNESIKAELISHNGVREADIFVSGIPQYDRYFTRAPSSREAFFERIGLDPRAKLVVYAPFGQMFSASDWDVIDLLHRLNAEGKFGAGVEILVRFQPNDKLDRAEVEKRPHLRYDYPGIRLSSNRFAYSTRSIDWDMDEADLAHLYDTLAHLSLLIAYATSMVVDAAIFEKPVININFDLPSSAQGFSQSPTLYYRKTHYRKALATGGIRLVGSPDELAVWVRRYLADPTLDREKRQRLVGEQCTFTDGRSAQRLAQAILRCLRD